MRRSLVAVFAAFLFFALAAHAGSVPTFTVTQGSAVIDINSFTLSPEIFFQFSGSGFSISGFGQIQSDFGSAPGNVFPPGFGPLDPGLSIFTDPSDGGIDWRGELLFSAF
jgi:hypothetical protein